MTFHLPSWICAKRLRFEPRCLVGENLASGPPKKSVGMVMESIAVMKVSVVRLGPAFWAARMKASKML